MNSGKRATTSGIALRTCSIPLPGGKQAKRQCHRLVFNIKLFFQYSLVRIRSIGDPVHDQVDLITTDAVSVQKRLTTSLGHHDQSCRESYQLRHHGTLSSIRLRQNRMQCRDNWHPQVLQESQNMTAAGTAKDPKFMLQTHNGDVAEIQKIGCGSVVFELLFDDLELNLLLIFIAAHDVIHGDHDAFGARRFGDRRPQVVSESGDATLAWQIVADESDFMKSGRGHDEESPFAINRITVCHTGRATLLTHETVPTRSCCISHSERS